MTARIMSRNRGNETAIHVWQAINFYGSHMLTHISPTISSLIRDRKQNARICYRHAVYAGASFLSLFFKLLFTASPSLACVRCDILCMEAVALFFFLFFSNYYNRRARAMTGFLRHQPRVVRTIIPQLNIRVRIGERAGYLSGHVQERKKEKKGERETACTFITRHFLRRCAYQLFYRALLLPLLGLIIHSPEFVILSAFVRARRNNRSSRRMLLSHISGHTKSILIILTYTYTYT